jgi:hypothetical protein
MSTRRTRDIESGQELDEFLADLTGFRREHLPSRCRGSSSIRMSHRFSYQGRLPEPLAGRLAGIEICVTFVTVGELGRRLG